MIATLLIGVAMSLGVAALSALGSSALAAILLVGYYWYARHLLFHDGLVIGVVFPMVVVVVIYAFLADRRWSRS